MTQHRRSCFDDIPSIVVHNHDIRSHDEGTAVESQVGVFSDPSESSRRSTGVRVRVTALGRASDSIETLFRRFSPHGDRRRNVECQNMTRTRTETEIPRESSHVESQTAFHRVFVERNSFLCLPSALFTNNASEARDHCGKTSPSFLRTECSE